MIARQCSLPAVYRTKNLIYQ